MTNLAQDQTLNTLRRALHHAETFLSALEERPVAATATLEELRTRIGVELNTDGMASEEVIDNKS